MATVGRIKELWRYPVKGMAGEQIVAIELTANGLSGDRQWALRDEARGEIQSCKTRPELLMCLARTRIAAGPPGIRANGTIPPVDITFPDGSNLGSDDPAIHARLTALVGKASTLQALRPAGDAAFYRRHKTDDHTWLKELAATFTREPGEPLPDFNGLPPILVDHVSVPGTFFLVTPVHVLTTATLTDLKRRNPSADWDARRFRPNVVIETRPELEGLVEQAWVGRQLQTGAATITIAGSTPRCGAITRAQSAFGFDAGVLRTVVKDADQNAGIYGVVEHTGALRVGDTVSLSNA